MKTRLLTTALLCTLLVGCGSEQDQESSKSPTDDVKAVTGGYVNLHAETIQNEIIEDNMAGYFMGPDINGAWVPDPGLSNSPGVKALYKSIAETCAFQIQLPLKNGNYQVARAYNVNAEFSKFFEGFTICVKNTIPYSLVPTEWLADFSQFHDFNERRSSPEIRTITGEKVGKNIKLKGKPITKQLDFDQLRQIIQITQKN